MQITFKAWNIIRYQSYDKKKSLARRQHVWMFSLFTMFKVSEHSFGNLWVCVIYQIMARGRLQLTSWNLASEKYTDEKFWLTGKMWLLSSFHGNINDWIQP